MFEISKTMKICYNTISSEELRAGVFEYFLGTTSQLYNSPKPLAATFSTCNQVMLYSIRQVLQSTSTVPNSKFSTSA